MTEFTPVSAVIGGSLIGVATVLLMAINGRTAGVSGIAHGAFLTWQGDFAWRLAFIAGLVAAPLIVLLVSGAAPHPVYPHSIGVMTLGGLLVGFGTRLSGGCTSGHGICGTAMLSRRSIVATLTFMATGVVTVFVLHRVIGV